MCGGGSSFSLPVCSSPSRSALQTGRNPTHVNLNNDDMALVNPADGVSGFQGIPRNMTTFAWKLASAGYASHFYGKWHVGLATPDHTPAGRGWQHSEIYFDGESLRTPCLLSVLAPILPLRVRVLRSSSLAFSGANDYYTSISGACPDPASLFGDKGQVPITDLWVTTAGGSGAPAWGLNNSWDCSQANQPPSCKYEDTMFVESTLAAIAAHNTSIPFLQVWTPRESPLAVPPHPRPLTPPPPFTTYGYLADNIHAPLQVPASYLRNFSFIKDDRRAAYAAKVRYVDDQLARVVAALKAKGMWDNLLFVLSAGACGVVVAQHGDMSCFTTPFITACRQWRAHL